MPDDPRGASERRRQRRAVRRASHRRAFAVGPVTREAQLAIGGLAPRRDAAVGERHRNVAGTGIAERGTLPLHAGGLKHLLADQLHAATLARVDRRSNERRSVGHALQVERQHRLDHDVRIGVLDHRAIVSARTICRRPCTATRSRESPECESAASGLFIRSRASARVERSEAFERPDARECARADCRRLRHRPESGHDRLVLPQDEQLLRRVAPPAIRMIEMRHQLRRRLADTCAAACDRASGRRT